ncbi:uncharacterized protein LOC101751416 isoform X4 [Gallus gallus]|uniref:uncharacterized protein LOC101751416 isoform X4 n=1 Tax=Gallus gallus TaxID=9031 RepID=UPI001AE25316|nr:uncharacterized protein LOC101751416 isoform X4 [Gallus gallus]
MRSPRSLLFSKLNKPSSLNLSSQERCSRPLIILEEETSKLASGKRPAFLTTNKLRQRAAEERGRRTPVLLLAVLSAGAFLWILTTWKTNVLQVSAGPVHELPCVGNSPVCLELKMKTIQFSARKDLILDAVFHSLEENGIDGLKREEILQLTREAVEKVMKHYTWLPSWALKTMGATIDVERTSKSYGGNRWLSPFFSSAKPPETILQPDISAGNCWAFQGSRGHVVIRLPEKIWPTAFTLWHISKAVSPSGEVSTAPREFAVSVSLCPLLLLEGPKEKLCHRAP